MYCHKCGSCIGNDGNEYCFHCGYDGKTNLLMILLDKQHPETCIRCGTENPMSAIFCQNCGYQIKKYTHCPLCRSNCIIAFEGNEFNWKNAVKGGLLGGLLCGPFAPIGLIAGVYIEGNKGKRVYHCSNCNHSWK
jgi:hypothetical protein